MKWFATVLFSVLMFSMPALAVESQGISTTDIAGSWNQLSPLQQAEMATVLAKKAAANRVPAVPTAEKVEPWLHLVTTLGDSLVKLAHDLGVEANELVTTPVGMMAMGLVAYHVVGPDILEIVVGFIWFFVTTPLLVLFFFKAVVPIKEYQEVEVKGWRGPKKVLRAIRRRPCFGCREDFNVDWVFVLLCVGNVFVTMVIIA